jgi:hypothetical protein
MNWFLNARPFLTWQGAIGEVRAPAKVRKLVRVSTAWRPPAFQQSAVSVFSGSAFNAHG